MSEASETPPSAPVAEPPVGTMLVSAKDGRIWQRGPFGWNSNQGWFGWQWDMILRSYSPDGLLTCTVGESLASTEAVSVPSTELDDQASDDRPVVTQAQVHYADRTRCGICTGPMFWIERNWPLWRRFQGRWAHRGCITDAGHITPTGHMRRKAHSGPSQTSKETT